ncbi:MAG: hypothetical protein M1831_003918 [Alyxoria varia]|nr:MAG: hypothetical protein M1831_003918 [Alyxoria varia]
MSLHIPAPHLQLTFPTLAAQDTLPGHTTSDTITSTSFKSPADSSTPHTTTLTLPEAVALSVTTTLPDGSTQQKHPALGRFDRATPTGGIRGGLFCKACGTRIAHFDAEDAGGVVSLKAGTLDEGCMVDARAAVHIWGKRMVRGVGGMLGEQRVPGAREGVREVWEEEPGEGSVLC